MRRPISVHRSSRDFKREAMLESLRKESIRASADRAVSENSPLSMLAYLAKVASPRAKSVNWCGCRFPLRHGFSINTVLCPMTGMPLVSAMALP